jgi:hypothetical protein
MRVVKSKHEHHNRQSHSTLEAGATQSDDAIWRGRSKLVGDEETLRALFSDRSMWFMVGDAARLLGSLFCAQTSPTPLHPPSTCSLRLGTNR